MKLKRLSFADIYFYELFYLFRYEVIIVEER